MTEKFWKAVETHDEFYLNVTNEPYMRLVIEVTSEGYVSVAHYYQQHGDAMRDPEVVFDPADWHAVEYTQDSLGIYQRIEPGYYSPGIETFAGMWARNIKAQGFCEVKPEVPAVS
jgi:hypothetical protein